MKTLGILVIGIVIISACFSQQSLAGDNAQEAYEIGLKSYNSKDYAEALKWYKKAADQGNVDAQTRIGFMYSHGQGVKKDYVEAVKWFREASEQGNAPAQSHLGSMYALGLGVTKDYAEALKWFRMAADQGDAPAQVLLSGMYLDGEGVPKDTKEAIKWLRMAADQGYDFAQVSMGIAYRNGEGVPRDIEEATKWFKKAADQGNADAKNVLSDMELNSGTRRVESWDDALAYYTPISGDYYVMSPPLKFPNETRYLQLGGTVDSLNDNTLVMQGSGGLWGLKISKVPQFVPRKNQTIFAIGKIISMGRGWTLESGSGLFIVIDPVAIIANQQLIYIQSPAQKQDKIETDTRTEQGLGSIFFVPGSVPGDKK